MRECENAAVSPRNGSETGPDLRGRANWAVAQGAPQLRGLHKKNSKKIIT